MKFLRSLSLGFAALGIVYSLRTPIRDVYTYLIPVDAIGTHSSMLTVPNYKLDTPKPINAEINKALSALENVPDHVQAEINRRGGTVVFCDTIKPDKQDLETFKKNLKNFTVTSDEAAEQFFEKFIDGGGYYRRSTKDAVVDQVTILPHGIGYVSLHEYGHMADYLLGRFSVTPEFMRHYDNIWKSWDVPIPSKEHEAGELFASGFAKFYLSRRSRQELKRDHPEMYNYFIGLENSLMKD